MKMPLTALSLMFVLGSVSSVQAATFTAAHDHTVYTHLGPMGVDSVRVQTERSETIPQGRTAKESCGFDKPCNNP